MIKHNLVTRTWDPNDITQMKEENKLLKKQIVVLTKNIQQLQKQKNRRLPRNRQHYRRKSKGRVISTTRDSVIGVYNASFFAITSVRETNKVTIFIGGNQHFKLNLIFPHNPQKYR